VDSRAQNISADDGTYGYYAALKYEIAKDFFVRTSYENAVRIPTAVQYFGDGNLIIRNLLLAPEKSSNLNLGINLRMNAPITWGIDVSGFYREQQDLIQLVSAGDGDIPQYQNQKGVETIGIESEAFVYPIRSIRLSGNVTRLSQKITELNTINLAQVGIVGAPNPNVPDFFINSQLEYINSSFNKLGHGLRVYLQYRFIDTFNHILVGGDFNPDNWVPSQKALSAGLTYTFTKQNISVSANAFNLTDVYLYDNYNLPRPGRNFNLKIQFSIDERFNN
ncbi:MAG: TonB-dependent receptor, partial [Bacteroidota bacterium]